MFIKDQVMAMSGLFYLSSIAQDPYAEEKFAPHSDKQMIKLAAIMDQYGFPGEKLIGTGLWATTILSHHNLFQRNMSLLICSTLRYNLN